MKKLPRLKTLPKLRTRAPVKKSKALQVSRQGAVKQGAKPSSISTHDYDPETRTLTVTFHHGKSYKYQDVPPELADGLRDASSKGKFLHANVIGKFDHGERK